MSRPVTRHVRLIACLLGAIVLTGCYRVNVSIDVADDGSGEASVLMALDPDAMLELLGPMAEAFGEEADESEFSRDALCGPEAMEESFGSVPDGVAVEPYDEDGFCGQRRSVEFAAGDDIGATIALLMDDGATDDDGEITIEENADGGWRFEAVGVAEPVSTEDDASEFIDPEMFEMLLGDAEMIFEVTLPGQAVDSNATSVDGATFRWELDVTDPVDEMYASTEPGTGSGSSAWIWIIVALGVVVAALAVVLVLRGRNTGDGTGDGDGPADGAPEPPSAFAPAPPPTVPAAPPPASPTGPPTAAPEPEQPSAWAPPPPDPPA